jgi:hypothetical protein
MPINHRGLANITNANRGLSMLTNVGDAAD